MCSIVFDAAYVFVYRSILDATVDVLTVVLVGEILPKVTISSLVYLLVIIVPLLAVVAGAPTTAVATSYLSAVVVGRVTAAMGARSW
jgi:hypothetical protein